MKFFLYLALLLPSACFGVVSDCTFYVSATGSGSGASPSVPAAISSVAANSSAGAVICFMGAGGTYNFASSYSLGTSGTSSNPVTWIAYGDSPVTFSWTGGSGSNVGTGRWVIEDYAAYTVISGINFVGNNYGNEAIYCASPGHHMTFENNTITGFIYTGVACSSFDYEFVLNNQIWLNGENPNGVVTITSNAGSGVSFNQQVQYDSYTGLHCVVVGNTITGQFDPTTAHTDGNGIILDLASAAQSGGCLVANNVVLMNGGIGIEINSGDINPSFPNPWNHVAVVNNTVAYSGLDLTRDYPPPNYANIHSSNVCYANNISQAWPYSGTLPGGWSTTPPNWSETYTTSGTIFAGNASSVSTNLWYQSIEGVSNTLLNANPLFLSPPTVSNTAGGQYASAPSPAALGDGMTIQAGSAGIGRGVDAAIACTNLPTQTITDMAAYIYSDIQDVARPNSGQNSGAYQGLVSVAQATSQDGLECTKINGAVCSGGSSVTMPDKFTLHDMSDTRYGNYLIVSPTGGEAAVTPGNWNSGTLSGQTSNAVWTGSASVNINNGVWSSTATYAAHQVVVYQNYFFTALTSSTNQAPPTPNPTTPTSNTYWEETEALPVNYYVSTTTTNIAPCTYFLNCNGHQAQGAIGNVYANRYNYALYSDPVINGLFNPGTEQLPQALPADFHGSWNQNCQTPDACPIGVSNTSVPADSSKYTAAYYAEIDAVVPGGSGPTYRYAHDYNTGSNEYFSPQNNIGQISYLGDFYAISSDMMGKRGSQLANNTACPVSSYEIGPNASYPPRGMYQPAASQSGVGYEDTFSFPNGNSAAPNIFQVQGFWNGSSYITTGTGQFGSTLPTYSTGCGSAGDYCTVDGTTSTAPLDNGSGGTALVRNLGPNECRADIVIVDTLSAKPAP